MNLDQDIDSGKAPTRHAGSRLGAVARAAVALGLLAAVCAAAAAEFKWVQDIKSCSAPEYPRDSLSKQEQGTVVVRVLVATDGKVVDSEIESSSRSRRLDEAARKALSACVYKPVPADAKPLQQWVAVQYVWKLD